MRMRRSPNRGTMYVVVLMTAMIVSVIGLSALATARVRLQTATGDANVAAARCGAQSAVEIGVLALTEELEWRTTFSHDVWSDEKSLGGGTYAWKLVDEVNGSLTADTTAPVRVYGRGIVGDSMRMFSVLVMDVSSVSNLLENADMESGTTSWMTPYTCTLSSSTSIKYDGSASLLVSSRSYWYSGAAQYLTDSLEDATTYELQVWVRPRTSAASMRFILYVNCSENGDLWFYSDPGNSTLGSWTLMEGQFTPDWNGTLNSAWLMICTTGGTSDFYIDDVMFRKQRTQSEIEIVPGTWRRDVSAEAAAEPDSGPILPAAAAAAAKEATAKATED